MGIIRREEMETHINMSRNSDKMQIYTSEKHIMRKLDKYVEESDDWSLVEIGKIHGEIVSKTYEAPRKLLFMRKQKRIVTDAQRIAASERFKQYWKDKKNNIQNEPSEYILESNEDEDFGLEDDELQLDTVNQSTATNKPANNKPNSDRLDPQKTKPKIKIDPRGLDDIGR